MLYGMVQGFKDGLMLSVRAKDAIRKAAMEAGRLDLVDAKEVLNKALEESAIKELPLFGQAQGADFGPVWKALISGDTSGRFEKMEMSRRAITGENMRQVFPRLSDFFEKQGFDLGSAADLLGETVRGPGRLLMTEDELFKSIGYRAELHARAFREVQREGLTGEAASRKMNEIFENPPEDIKADAIDYSHYLTFTTKLNTAENALSRIGGKVQEAASLAPPLRFIVPFVRTPVNILKFTLERTPLGLFMKDIRQDIFHGTGADRALAIARMSLGSMVMAISFELTMGDMLTGGGPGDRDLREAKMRGGWQPYSIKVGDRYVAYNRLDPFGSILGMAADTAEVWRQIQEEGWEDNRSKLGVMVTASLAKNLTNKTYLEGLSRVIDVIHNPDRYGGDWVSRFIGSFVPSGAAHIERLVDPTVRETQGFVDLLKSRIPGLSDTLPPKRNLWGDPIVFEGALGPDIVSPFYTSRDKHSAIDDEIVRNRVQNINTPSAKQIFQGIELSPAEHSRFLEIMGKELRPEGKDLKETLETMIQTPEYQALTDGPEGGKAFAISRIVHQYREQAKNKLMSENAETRDKVLGIKTKKIQARTGAVVFQ
jgi:hypothetical protein